MYIKISVSRFDVDFYNTDIYALSEVKSKYPLFFSKDVNDSVWINKRNDKDERDLFDETQKIFSNFIIQKEELINLFKHILYYNPQFKIPKVITLLSNVDYENKVIFTKDLLLISLDVYMGKNHPFYDSFPKYIKQNYHKERIVVDVANEIIKTQIPLSTDRTFLGKMIEAGKKLYLLDVYLPEKSDKEKIGYEDIKLDWTLYNEAQIWKYFIENKLLYSTDTKLNKRFLDNSPFSKFYRAEDNLSPGRIGTWFGWQIVRSYMKYNNVSIENLLEMDAEKIFRKSKYKPKKQWQ